VVGDEQPAEAAGERILRPVPEIHPRVVVARGARGSGASATLPLRGNAHGLHEPVHGYSSEYQHRRDPFEQSALPDEPFPAGFGLPPRRLVVGGRAPDDGGHPGVLQPQAVSPRHAFRPAGKAGPVKGRDEERGRAVAGEHPPGPVTAVRGRGQADNEQARFSVAESGDGLPPVFLTAVGRALFPRGPFPVANEAGTPSARGNPPPERGKSTLTLLGHLTPMPLPGPVGVRSLRKAALLTPHGRSHPCRFATLTPQGRGIPVPRSSFINQRG